MEVADQRSELNSGWDLSKTSTNENILEKRWNMILTNGMPFVALSSKNLDGLKKLPYSCDHFFRLVYT